MLHCILGEFSNRRSRSGNRRKKGSVFHRESCLCESWKSTSEEGKKSSRGHYVHLFSLQLRRHTKLLLGCSLSTNTLKQLSLLDTPTPVTSQRTFSLSKYLLWHHWSGEWPEEVCTLTAFILTAAVTLAFWWWWWLNLMQVQHHSSFLTNNFLGGFGEIKWLIAGIRWR